MNRTIPSARLLAIRTASWIAAILLCAQATAQVSTLKFDRFTSENGLSDNYVLCALEDNRGFMWFGTRDGLNRFDGCSFVVYRHDPGRRESLSDASAKCIYQDRHGELWVGTHSAGLERFDRVTEQFHHYHHSATDPRSIGDGPISSLCEDTNGDLWAATVDRASGVSRLDRADDRFTRFEYDPHDPYSLSSNNVVGVCRDSSGALWVATADAGLNRYVPALCGFINRNTVPAYDCGMREPIVAVHADLNGRVQVLTTNRMVLFDPAHASATMQRLNIAVTSSPLTLAAVLNDRNGTCWIASLKHGVIAHNPQWDHDIQLHNSQSTPNSLASNVVFCICQDHAGNVWFGTEHGISRLNRRMWQFRCFQHDPEDSGTISAPIVRSLARDSSGTLWIGTDGGGLDQLRQGSTQAIHQRFDNDTIGSDVNVVNTVLVDAAQTKWLGTNWGLVHVERNGTYRIWRNSSHDSTSLGAGGVWSILEDHAGRLWVGTFSGGINLLDRRTGRFRHYLHHPDDRTSLSNNSVLSLFESRDGAIWAGTDNGLNRFDPATGGCRQFTNDVDDSTSLSNNRVWYVHEDEHGMLWIATSGGGINMMDPATGRCVRYMENNGLASNTTAAIVEDEHGRMWVSTIKGLSCIDPASGTIRNYMPADGLAVYEYHFKACCHDYSGMMYFGGTNGITYFRPSDLVDNMRPPPVELTSFHALDSTFRLDSSITTARSVHLEHDNNSFSIEFAALDLTNALGNRYRYMLEGFDRDWHTVPATHRFAEYTNVPPGQYRFMVMGANSDNVWSPDVRTLELIITPAYWQTWWFRVLALLAVAAATGLLLVIWVRSVRGKEQLERRLVEFQLQALRAQMNPHFMFNALNSILHFVVRRDIESAQFYLSAFSKLVRNTLENVRSDSVLLADELASLRLYLEIESLRFRNRFRASIDVAPNVDPDQTEIPPMIIQPYVENSIRHGLAHKEGGGSIIIRITRGHRHLICSIIDDGVGRRRSEEIQRNDLRAHRMHGIALTRNRLETLSQLHRQRYHVEITDLVGDGGSALGTRVDISIPIDVTTPSTSASATTSSSTTMKEANI
ncbi:MAG: histidine kinase [Bacteroidetes bacterium]|nr:histidine kinase [Bacteroidota bacterium]